MHEHGENNGEITGRDRYGRFDGSRPGPGRPRGSRNKSTLMLAAINELADRSPDAIEGALDRMVQQRPLDLIKLWVRLQPREYILVDPNEQE